MLKKVTKFEKLENRRSIFLEIGAIIALVLVLCAFNWKSYEKVVLPAYYRGVDNTPVEMAPVTIQKPPELPKMKKPVLVYAFNIVDNESPVEDDFFIDAEADPLDSVMVYVPKPSMGVEEGTDEEDIFTVVESMPEFPGGIPALYKYLSQNINYPEAAKAAGISGKVYVMFVVEKDGTITDVQLKRGIGGGCDEEAMRVVSHMPLWKPGLQRNHPVRVQYLMDVKFTLAEL
jgi:periplasmic protein TonB